MYNLQQIVDVPNFKRNRPVQQLVRQDTDAPNINLAIIRQLLNYLW